MTTSLNVQVGGSHYKDFVIQPVEFIFKNSIPFIEGCIIKYICRWRAKGGVQDLLKVRHYIDMLIELENGQPGRQVEEATEASQSHCQGLISDLVQAASEAPDLF